MKSLAHAIFEVITDEYGVDGAIERLADPLWFQSLSCTLAYDWHSSGTTTVVCGVLKSVIKPEEFGIGIAGGKGKASRNTLLDIEEIGEKLGLSDGQIEEMKYASRISAKVDNACVQDGYQLYHHAMIISEKGKWAVVQQGMNPLSRYARRYHWLSSSIKKYEEEPHEGIIGVMHMHNDVLDMTSKESRGCRKVAVDLTKTKTREVERLYKELGGRGNKGIRMGDGQKTLFDFYPDAASEGINGKKTISPINTKGSESVSAKVFHVNAFPERVFRFRLPRRVNWEALRVAYERQPRNYEELLCIRGIGPATIRALALISELIYGEEPSWKDPVKFSFAFGGKDGVPYPVDRKTMDEVTDILSNAMKGGIREKTLLRKAFIFK
jgi:hypothetical protein